MHEGWTIDAPVLPRKHPEIIKADEFPLSYEA